MPALPEEIQVYVDHRNQIHADLVGNAQRTVTIEQNCDQEDEQDTENDIQLENQQQNQVQNSDKTNHPSTTKSVGRGMFALMIRIG